MLLVWDQTSFTGVTPSCHLDSQESLGLVKQMGEELPLDKILEQAGVDECRLQHGSQAQPRFRDNNNNTRTTVAEFPEEEFSVFLSLPKEWEAKAVFCK